MQILDLPNDCGDLHLNNQGQIAGTYLNGVFIWDKITGFYKIGAFDGEVSIVKFNDKGQILIQSWKNGTVDRHIYIWDYGITKEISRNFLEKFPDYSNVQASSMNNKGEIILTATPLKSSSFDFAFEKSFMWSDGKLTELFNEYGNDTRVYVRDIDDDGNMLVETSTLYDTEFHYYMDHFYFMNPSKIFQAEIVDYNRNVIIRNSAPQIVFCLPSELKTRFDGTLYYTPGAEIRKLIKPQLPYWFQTGKDLRIHGQNSQGYVVGDSETIYLRKRHAFLAVPVGTKM